MAEPLIVRTPGVCGGRARVAGTRIAVWLLEEYRREGWAAECIAMPAFYPHLTIEQVHAAWDYAAKHPAEIQRDVDDNTDG